MGLDRMFSRIMYSVENQLTYKARQSVTNKISDLFSGKKNESSEEPKSSAPNDKKKLVIASAHVGFAASYADGELDASESAAIDKFKDQLASNGDNDLAIEVMKVKGKKPNFEEAMQHVDQFPNDMLSFFEGLIDDVLKADGEVSDQEKVFLDKWNQYKAKRS